eukprot:5080400-Lingulodinium_polyedra.AAC.1
MGARRRKRALRRARQRVAEGRAGHLFSRIRKTARRPFANAAQCPGADPYEPLALAGTPNA